MKPKRAFLPGDILLPKNCDNTKWSVVACDQYTSEPSYWDAVEQFVGDAPSTYHMIVPEIFLEDSNVSQRIEAVNQTMNRYLENDLFEEVSSFLYIERTLKNGKVRKGIIGVIDLEAYDYTKGAQSMVRATEGTVLERIPPRVRVRENASLELPHIMILIDDPSCGIIEPLEEQKQKLRKVYDFPLMMDSGKIEGYALTADWNEKVLAQMDQLADPAVFEKKYQVAGAEPFVFAMGDGNHSLATAKTCYENLKKTMPESEYLNHPARYALAEVVNLHDASLEFEAIHRVVFDIEPEQFLSAMKKYYDIAEGEREGAQSFTYQTKNSSGVLSILNPSSNLTVGSLQNFIDAYLKELGGRVDYIHGEDVVEKLASEENRIGFILPCMRKDELFKTVLTDGVLPRKTFSMGHAEDKRFYLECRKIK